jgi:hypothetical protein
MHAAGLKSKLLMIDLPLSSATGSHTSNHHAKKQQDET